MGKFNVAKIGKSVQMTIGKHSPEILTGIGIAGMLATTVLAVRATPKALTLLSAATSEKGEDLTVPEKVKTCWKCYIPATVTGVTSIACLIGASSVNAKRNAALTAAYTLSDSALREYRDKVVETIGEKKEQVVRDKIAENQVKKDPASDREVIVTGKGETLCYEPISGRYFKSDVDRIKRAENTLNKNVLSDPFNTGVSLNDFYDEIGLSKTSMGETIGWNLDIGLIDIRLSAQLTEDDNPCLVIDYKNPPTYNF